MLNIIAKIWEGVMLFLGVLFVIAVALFTLWALFLGIKNGTLIPAIRSVISDIIDSDKNRIGPPAH